MNKANKNKKEIKLTKMIKMNLKKITIKIIINPITKKVLPNSRADVGNIIIEMLAYSTTLE